MGTAVGTFHDSTTVEFAHQLVRASDGNVWLASFLNDVVCKLDAATGDILTTFPASSARGVFELQNGDVLWTSSSGAFVWDAVAQTSTQVYVGWCNHLNPYGGGGPAGTTSHGVGCDGLVHGAVGLPQIGNAGFRLAVANVPAVSPVALVGFGTTALDPGIDLTAFGMAGCFAHTNLDLGMVTSGPIVGGVSTVLLPLPNDPLLVGTQFASQGLSFSTATPLQLAVSNGLSVVVRN
jgi:hypothetical protein